MERTPWWSVLEGPFPTFKGPVGVKEDGGGCIRGCGRVGPMTAHRAACNQDEEEMRRLVSDKNSGPQAINEVEAAGNTPLHNAAYVGWCTGAELLISAGAKVNASNNAGDTPWQWARNMGHQDMMELLEKHGASKQKGKVLVQEHVPKVKDFYAKECWAHHPKPYEDFIDFKQKERHGLEEDRKRAIKF